MRWRELERSAHVEDRRLSPLVLGGGLGVLAFIVAFVVFLIPGGDDPNPLDVLSNSDAVEGTLAAEELEAGEFVEAVVGSTETYWGNVFEQAGLDYREPVVILFNEATSSACGLASAEVGPHYCPTDETIYLDLGFFDDLERYLGAGGDFAEAYVIAHEVGHHVQNLLGIMDQARDLAEDDPGTNTYGIALELQADCLAGTWAHSILRRGDVLEPGDIEEAMTAAAAVGDDRLQQSAGTGVNPETWTHGSSEQRVAWFSTGYDNGEPSSCDTFE